MTRLFIILWMIFFHIVDDYYLQGWLASAKQKSYWEEQKGINWNDFPTQWKRGVCWTKEKGLDYEMPMLKGEGRAYLEKLVHYQEEE